MARPTQTNGPQQRATIGFFIWLGTNPIPVGIILVLLVGAITVFLVQAQSWRKEVPEEPKAKWTDKNGQDSRYFHEDRDREPS
jgi:hypothetical protein